MTQTREEKAWNILLNNSLKLPSVKVEKASWFEKILSPWVSDALVRGAIASSPTTAGIERRTIKKIADAAVRAHRRGVTTLSLLTGLPGGLLLAGAVPADLAQFFWHVTKIAQKLTLLYGWPDLLDDPKECDEATKLLLTLLTAQMFGSDRADDLVGTLHNHIATSDTPIKASELIERCGVQAEAEALREWMGLTATRDGLTKTLARIVPVIGGLFSGTLSYIAFTKMTSRLNRRLHSLSS